MTPEQFALRTTYGVWEWLLSLPEDYLSPQQTMRVIDLTRSLYYEVLALEQPQLSLVARRARG